MTQIFQKIGDRAFHHGRQAVDNARRDGIVIGEHRFEIRCAHNGAKIGAQGDLRPDTVAKAIQHEPLDRMVDQPVHRAPFRRFTGKMADEN